MAIAGYESVQVFSATKFMDRDALGEKVSAWLSTHGKELEVVDTAVLQSSDSSYHCITIIVFLRRRARAAAGKAA